MKYHQQYLTIMLLSASTGLFAPNSYADNQQQPAYGSDHQIQGTNAGGESQTTIIDENGSLKMVPKKDPQDTNTSEVPTASDQSSNPPANSEPTSPGMSQGMPTPTMEPKQNIINSPGQATPQPGQPINNNVPAVQNQPSINSAVTPAAPKAAPAAPANQAPGNNQAGQPSGIVAPLGTPR